MDEHTTWRSKSRSVLPPRADVLDVGCGNGFIAHHLQSMLGTTVVGLDVGASTAARINYLPYDGRHFPVRDQSFDAVLLCYVLHHAQDPRLVLNEVSRVLRDGGLAIIYEDIPYDLVGPRGLLDARSAVARPHWPMHVSGRTRLAQDRLVSRDLKS